MDLFIVTDLWSELMIPQEIVRSRYKNYYDGEITLNNESATVVLFGILDKCKKSIIDYITSSNIEDILLELGLDLNIIYSLYKEQRKKREFVKSKGIRNIELANNMLQYMSISRNLINSINLWIENTVIINNNYTNNRVNKTREEKIIFLIDLYIYGIASSTLTLTNLNKKTNEVQLLDSIIISSEREDFIKPNRTTTIFFNPLLTGNQAVLHNESIDNVEKTDYGKTFRENFGVIFSDFLALLMKISNVKFMDSEYPVNFIEMKYYVKLINTATKEKINFNSFFEEFTLTRDKLLSQLVDEDDIIWKFGVNRFRFELCPFIALPSSHVLICNSAADHAIHVWTSNMKNGGILYTNYNDRFYSFLLKYNLKLSDTLLKKIASTFRIFDKSCTIECNIPYYRIWKRSNTDYGDFDIIAYSKQHNSIYFVESKFVSDSLTASAFLRDFNEMFKSNGYYYKFKRRVDLVMGNPNEIKKYFSISSSVIIHFLYITSKPININIADKENRIYFLCMENLHLYLDKIMIDNNGNKIQSIMEI